MKIFSRLLSRFSREDAPSEHPFASHENMRALIAEFDSSDSSRYLAEIQGWLNEIERVVQDLGAEVAHRALVQLDNCGRNAAAELLDRYLLSSERQSMDDVAWSALSGHATALFSAYATILGKLVPLVNSDAGKSRMARGGVAAFRAWSLQMKLQHFRYRQPAAALWQDAHKLLSLLLSRQLERVLVVPSPGEPAVTPLREYLIGLYAECLPTGNLTPPQMETLDRFLRSCESLECTSELQEYSTHRIDFSAKTGPRAARDDDLGGQSVRFCSTQRLHKSLIEFADKLAAGREIPQWLSAIPLSLQLKEAAVRSVAQHWSPSPPHRNASRRGESLELIVVMGFDRVAHMMSLAQRVRAQAGNVEATQPPDPAPPLPTPPGPKVFVETAFGNVPVIDDPVNPSPYVFDPEPDLNPVPAARSSDTLLRLEGEDGESGAEIWNEVDSSVSGLGATLPALLPRHRVGTLVALRSGEGREWRPAIIRRIGRDAANRPNIGVETLGAEPIFAQASLIGGDNAWTHGADGASGWSDIIVFNTDRNEVLLPHGSFATGKQINVMSDEGSWHIQLHTLVERGADYDRAIFVPPDLPSADSGADPSL